MPGWGSMLQRGSYIANNLGRLGMYAAKGGLGRTTAGAMWGAGYGAMSDDTSVLGGALMGAGITRYGGAGIRRARLGMRGIGTANPRTLGMFGGFGKGAWNKLRMDYRVARLQANRGLGKIRGLWRR